MMHLLTTAALAFTLLSNPTHAHGALEHIAISGWYSECDLEADSLEESCAGDFVLNDEPAELDKTGNTCYVNPLQANITDVATVFWFGPFVNQTGIYLYASLLVGEDNVTAYKPTNCSANNGACECGPFDDLRGSDWLETGSCGGRCAISQAENGLELLEGKDCAVLFTVNTTDAAGDNIGMCPILGKLIDTDEDTTSGVVKASLVTTVVASIVGFVAVL